MQKLPVRQRLLLGFTLFSMFFGAGNLIFPPHLGAQAGSNFWPAFAGFAVSAIGLPIAGVVAVARAGGFDQLASRVHPKFSLVFTILVYLSIGPCLAIPRTASTSFAMLEPLAGESTALQWGYSLLFFAVAFLVAQHPEKLTQRLGKILCPALLALILLLVLALWGLSFNHLMLSAVHPALADSRGVRVFWQEALFSAAIAVVVTVSMTWVGLLVINSLLVLPAAAARNISRNMFQYHLCSLLFAVGAGIAGLMTSYYIGSSAGASITLYLAGIFLVTFLLRKRG